MTTASLDTKIERALRSGPLFTPLLRLVVGEPTPREFRAALARLSRNGQIEATGGGEAWKLKP